MTLMRAAVLRPGDWVRYDGADHQVIALAGTSVRLRSDVGAESVVLVAYLMASPEFAVIDGAPTPSGYRPRLVRVPEPGRRRADLRHRLIYRREVPALTGRGLLAR